MAKCVKGAPSKIKSGSFRYPNNTPFKMVDARPGRKTLLITSAPTVLAFGDSTITSDPNGGGYIPHNIHHEIATADEVWAVARDGEQLNGIVSWLEIYDE